MASEEARQKAEDEVSRLSVERVSLLLELGISKDELSALRLEALEEKKALEEAYDEGFDVIFNYGHGCCVFAHNICGSELVVPEGMPDMSKLLPSEFFINTRCPQGVIPEVLAAVPDADTSEAGKQLSAAEVGLGNQSDSSTIVTRESEEPGASGGS